jgi:hypothetical protein
LINWVNPKDSILWEVDFANKGKYKFTIEYQCPEKDLGSEIQLTVGDNKLKSKITKAFDQPLYPTHDRAPRAGELQKPWGKLELDELSLKSGLTKISLSALKLNGNQVMEVKGIIVEKID